jgi:hypothetical protein
MHGPNGGSASADNIGDGAQPVHPAPTNHGGGARALKRRYGALKKTPLSITAIAFIRR